MAPKVTFLRASNIEGKVSGIEENRQQRREKIGV
jgi:hypothetical protein